MVAPEKPSRKFRFTIGQMMLAIVLVAVLRATLPFPGAMFALLCITCFGILVAMPLHAILFVPCSAVIMGFIVGPCERLGYDYVPVVVIASTLVSSILFVPLAVLLRSILDRFPQSWSLMALLATIVLSVLQFFALLPLFQ